MEEKLSRKWNRNKKGSEKKEKNVKIQEIKLFYYNFKILSAK